MLWLDYHVYLTIGSSLRIHVFRILRLLVRSSERVLQILFVIEYLYRSILTFNSSKTCLDGQESEWLPQSAMLEFEKLMGRGLSFQATYRGDVHSCVWPAASEGEC